jgi:penicillin-binding protein 1A
MTRKARRPDPKASGPVAGKSAGKPTRSAPAPTAAAPRAAPPRPLGRRVLGFVARWCAVVAIWIAVAVGAVVGWYAIQLPPIGQLEDMSRRPTVTVLAADGSMLANYGDLYGTAYAVKDLPSYLPRAVIAIEDRRFYSHFGVDVIGLVRAAWVNHRSGRVVQGGSTLTQQLAKNLFLTNERSFKRKIQEVLLALWLEHRYSKDQLLAIYLNRVYLGAGAYGVDAASRLYFGKPATRISLHEAAVLAGLLKAPVRFSPARDPERAAGRADIVLGAMVDAGFITPEQAETARGDMVSIAHAADKRPGHYFADWISDQLPGFVHFGDSDLVVVSTLDPSLQRTAEAQLAATLDADSQRRKARQAAVVVLGRDGAVRAMVGGRDYGQTQFNRAVTALRQPGSSFKLFTFLAALESGMTPSSTVLDAPIRVGGWSPENYEGRYLGEVTLADALAHSLNSATVRLIQHVGVHRVIALARRLGITTRIPDNMSIALGTSEVSLLELTGAYAAVAGDGIGVWPYGIAEVRDRAGHVLWRRSGSGPGRVLEAETARGADLLLGEVVRRGTGKAAALAVHTAGKTGTTQDYRDAWFVGYAGGLTAGVWFGNDDNSPMDKVTGGDLPAKLWHAIMQPATGGSQSAAAASPGAQP